jgi:HK97 family phage major capsid protein
LANSLIYNKIRAFDTAGGAGMWVQLPDGRPGQMIGRPVYEAESVDGTYGSGENYVLVFGDFANYVITDRIGLTVEFIPHLFHTREQPAVWPAGLVRVLPDRRRFRERRRIPTARRHLIRCATT